MLTERVHSKVVIPRATILEGGSNEVGFHQNFVGAVRSSLATGCSLGTVKINMPMREPYDTKYELELVYQILLRFVHKRDKTQSQDLVSKSKYNVLPFSI